MSLDDGKWMEQREKYPQVKDCIGKSRTADNALPCYEYLNKLKNVIPKELFAHEFRTLLQFNTYNVPKDLRLEMFEGLDPADLMYKDEIEAIAAFPEFITVYRGTSIYEKEPGLSWSLRKSTAEEFAELRWGSKSRVFEATIPKLSILLYFAHEEDEAEIIADVTEGYKIL